SIRSAFGCSTWARTRATSSSSRTSSTAKRSSSSRARKGSCEFSCRTKREGSSLVRRRSGRLGVAALRVPVPRGGRRDRLLGRLQRGLGRGRRGDDQRRDLGQLDRRRERRLGGERRR